MQLREIYPQILELGADAVAIGPKPAVMAQNQLDQGFPFALLMDPDHTVRKSLEVDQLTPAQLLKPQGLMNYAKSIGSWRSFGIEIDQATNRPGAFILDAEQNVAWSHIGDTLGDYPDTSEVIAQLTKLS